VNSGDWTLGDESEERILNPWLASEPDADVRRRVLEWLAELVNDPLRRGREDEAGVFYGRVVGTRIGVVYSLDHEAKRVMLVDIRDAG
jgi:hypothetical protein